MFIAVFIKRQFSIKLEKIKTKTTLITCNTNACFDHIFFPCDIEFIFLDKTPWNYNRTTYIDIMQSKILGHCYNYSIPSIKIYDNYCCTISYYYYMHE